MVNKEKASRKSRTRGKGRRSTAKGKPQTPRSRTPGRAARKSSTKSRASKPRTAPRARPSSSASSPQPANTTRTDREAELSSLRHQFEQVLPLIALASLTDQLEDLTSTVNGLDHEVAELRSAGYIFDAGWDLKVPDLQAQWEKRSREAQELLRRERRTLESTRRTVENVVERAARNHSLLASAEERVDQLEDRARDARRRIEGTYDQTSKEIYQLSREISAARSLLAALDEASFRLYPDEHGYRISKAAWEPAGNEPIEGVLFLTDSRLLFEQRQEVATKKILFITTEKKMVQELLWEAPVGGIEVLEVEDQKRFMRRNKELLVLRLKGGDGPPEVTINLKEGTNEEWRRLLQRARDDGFSTEAVTSASEAGPAEESAAAESVELPTECPNCGAQLPTIYQGMQQITCEYCGTSVSTS